MGGKNVSSAFNAMFHSVKKTSSKEKLTGNPKKCKYLQRHHKVGCNWQTYKMTVENSWSLLNSVLWLKRFTGIKKTEPFWNHHSTKRTECIQKMYSWIDRKNNYNENWCSFPEHIVDIGHWLKLSGSYWMLWKSL